MLDLINERSNICNQIHIPAQSGSTSVLEAMRRGYTREAYIELIQHIKQRIPGKYNTSNNKYQVKNNTSNKEYQVNTTLQTTNTR